MEICPWKLERGKIFFNYDLYYNHFGATIGPELVSPFQELSNDIWHKGVRYSKSHFLLSNLAQQLIFLPKIGDFCARWRKIAILSKAGAGAIIFFQEKNNFTFPKTGAAHPTNYLLIWCGLKLNLLKCIVAPAH